MAALPRKRAEGKTSAVRSTACAAERLVSPQLETVPGKEKDKKPQTLASSPTDQLFSALAKGTWLAFIFPSCK